MNTATPAIGVMLSATACALSAQQQSIPDMPGMDMPMPQGSKASPPAETGKPNRNEKPPQTMPKDIRSMGQDSGNRKAQQNAANEENPVQQQAGQVNQKPGDGSDQQLIQVPIQQFRKPEATDFHTGGDMAAPELLSDIVKRERQLPCRTMA